jgi:hypothetical protein
MTSTTEPAAVLLAADLIGYVSVLARAMEAARIEMIQNGPEKAMQWILNALPDQWDREAWDGSESAQEWFDRTGAP